MKAFLLSLAVLAAAARADWMVHEKMTEVCQDGSWEVSNSMIQIGENGTLVLLDTVCSDANSTGPMVHQVRLTFPRCENSTVQCENNTVTVNDLDCDTEDLPQFTRDACDVATALATWERQTRFFQNALQPYSLNLCITHTAGRAYNDLYP